MSDKTIRVELTEDEARLIAHGSGLIGPFHVVAEQCRAALPPEYAEGTVAWVTTAERRHLAVRHDGAWVSSFDADDEAAPARWIDPNLSVKVEPLRVLADDELAVTRGELRQVFPGGASEIRAYAAVVKRDGRHSGATALNILADALDAEARP